MDREKWMQALRARGSPFAAQVSSDPFVPRAFDVPGINAAAVDGLFGLIRQKQAHPEVPLGGLLEGEVGAGKTHLIGTLCQRLGDDGAYLFADVPPLIDPARPISFATQHIVTSLVRKPPGASDASQLDRTAVRVMADFLRRIEDRRAATLADQLDAGQIKLSKVSEHPQWDTLVNRVRDWFGGEHPGAWDECVRVFFQYAAPAKRRAVIRWLSGEEPGDEDARLLGVGASAGDREPGAREERASRVLRTLGSLLRYDRPLVVTFDQLECLDTPELVRAFGQVLFQIYNYAPSMLVLVSVRSEKWKQMRREMDAAVVQRVESNEFRLEPCTREWALELVRARLRAAALPADAPDLFPFDRGPLKAGLDALLGEGRHSARLVLQRVNRLWNGGGAEADGPVVDPTVEFLAGWHRRRTDELAHAFADHPASEAVLARALRLQLSSRSGCRFPASPVDHRYVDLVAQLADDHPRVGFLIDTAVAAAAVATSFKHGARALADRAVDRLVFVREARAGWSPSWKVVNQLADAFATSGGVRIELTDAEAAGWYALVDLQRGIVAGDIVLPDPMRVLNEADLDRFLREREPLPRFGELFAACRERPAAARAPVADLEARVVALLETSPVKLMQAAKVLDRLGVRMALDELLARLGARVRAFRIHGGDCVLKLVVE